MILLNVNYETLKTYHKVFRSHALVFYHEADAASFQSFDVVIVPAHYATVFKFSAAGTPAAFHEDFPNAEKVEKII